MSDTTDATTKDATSDATTTDTTTSNGTDMAAEVAKWKDLARKNKHQAKANLKELDALKTKSMTDQEKAVDAAKAEGRAEATREVGGKLAEAAIRVAASTRMTAAQLDGLLEGIDASKFLDASGDPDTKAITAWVDKVAPVSDAGHKKPNVVPREGTTTSKPAEDEVRAMARTLFKRGND